MSGMALHYVLSRLEAIGDVDPSGFAVAVVVAHHVSPEGRACMAGRTRIAHLCGKSEKAVSRGIAWCKKFKILDTVQERDRNRSFKGQQYTLIGYTDWLERTRDLARGEPRDIVARGEKEASESASEEAENHAGAAGQTVSHAVGHAVGHNVPQTSIEPVLEPEEREARESDGQEGEIDPETSRPDGGDAVDEPLASEAAETPGRPERSDGDRNAPDGGGEAADTPGRAEFEKRVMRFCNGRGFAAGPWRDWDTSSPGWIARQFAALSVAERADAERWRDPYLLDLAARKKNPVPVGTFLRDRLWTGLDPMLLERAERHRQARLAPEERPRPDGWAACMGPVGMAWLMAKLLAGPEDAEAMARPIVTEAVLRDAWPALWWWQAVQRQRGGAAFDPQWHALKGAMEPVPAGTAMLARWRSEFEARGWKWLSAFDQAAVVYLPVGGPEGLEAFRAAVASRSVEAVE
jgi:hypothetical protein